MSENQIPWPRAYRDLLEFVIRLFPNGELEKDNGGQYVIYTGLKADENPEDLGDPEIITL